MNAAGQVVAVNSAKIAIAGYEGLGFSIPIAEAQDIVNDLIQYGYVTGRVSLGIKGYTVNQANYKGFLIDSIVSGSPLEGTGAQKGDLITHVDGVRVNSYGELRGELSKHSVGDTVTLTILRVEKPAGQHLYDTDQACRRQGAVTAFYKNTSKTAEAPEWPPPFCRVYGPESKYKIIQPGIQKFSV